MLSATVLDNLVLEHVRGFAPSRFDGKSQSAHLFTDVGR